MDLRIIAYCLLQPPACLSFFDPNILLSNVFSNTVSLCSFLNVWDYVSHPHEREKIITLYILIFTLLDIGQKDKRFLIAW
jgi:hypothetical protein